MSIDRGDTRRLTVTILLGDTPADPGGLTFSFSTPGSVETTYEFPASPQIVRQAAGVYYVDLVLNETGPWVYQWQSVAPAQVQGDTLIVEAAPLDGDNQRVARGLLARMTSADTEPTLSDNDLDALLKLAAIPDVSDLSATDAGWIATYDLNFGAAEGWRWKAAKAAASYAFTMDGESPERSFLMIRCEHMADRYSKKVVTSVQTSTGYALPSYIPLI